MDDKSRNVEPERLSFLLGSWTNHGKVSAGPFGPGGETSGRTSYKWDIGSAWLTYKSELNLPVLGRYEVAGGVTFDSKRSIYTAYAANSLGKLITYDGHWETDDLLVFTQVFPLPAGQARVSYEKLRDNAVRMFSERKSGEGEFETYFETIMELDIEGV